MILGHTENKPRETKTFPCVSEVACIHSEIDAKFRAEFSSFSDNDIKSRYLGINRKIALDLK